MKLIVKFNLVFIAVFLIGLGLAAHVADQLLQYNAREEMLQNARLMMEAALATRGYTSSQVRPLLQTQMKYGFLPQSVPAYAATEVFNELRKKYPEYAYKEATLNPTNPRNRAVDWEADVVNQFRNNTDHTEIIGERDTPTGRLLYIARPIQISDAACLACHSTVDAAPKTMIDRYGAGERLRLEAERDRRRAGRLGADRRSDHSARAPRSAASCCRSPGFSCSSPSSST